MILKTRNYNRFSLIQGNRFISESHLKKMIKSIGHNNLLPQNPIIVNKQMQVIDGQHRLKAAETLNLPIYYTVIEKGSIEEVQFLNANQKSWSLFDFVQSYAERGNINYIALKKFSEEYNLPLSISAELIGVPQRHQTDVVKNGTFIAQQEEKGRKIANCLMEYRRYANSNILRSRDFVRAVKYMVENEPVRHFELIRKLALLNKKIEKQASFKNYLRVFEDVYNWKRGNGVVRIF